MLTERWRKLVALWTIYTLNKIFCINFSGKSFKVTKKTLKTYLYLCRVKSLDYIFVNAKRFLNIYRMVWMCHTFASIMTCVARSGAFKCQKFCMIYNEHIPSNCPSRTPSNAIRSSGHIS